MLRDKYFYEEESINEIIEVCCNFEQLNNVIFGLILHQFANEMSK